MAFDVKIAQEVFDYINACERLTPADRARITDGISEELGRSADEFLAKNPHPFLADRF